MAWKSDELHVDIKQYCSSQLIHVEVTPIHGNKFQCTFIYGATDKKTREDLFSQHKNIHSLIESPWLLVGDFNCIANLNERIDQRPRNNEIEPLMICMENCGIHDLKSTGRFFTLSNKQEGALRVLSKIDRVMGNHG